jgi:hypothetical protein
MDQDIRNFTAQWLRVALAALVPVVVTAFVSIPFNLGTIPGEQAVRLAAGERHMT